LRNLCASRVRSSAATSDRASSAKPFRADNCPSGGAQSAPGSYVRWYAFGRNERIFAQVKLIAGLSSQICLRGCQ
jgi:hypothetical protein